MAEFNQRIYDTLTTMEKQLYVRFDHSLELTMPQLAEYMGYNKARTVHTLVSAGTFEIPTYRRGRHRYASIRHVAMHQEAIEREALKDLAKNMELFKPKDKKDILARYGGDGVETISEAAHHYIPPRRATRAH